ncbi:hypothetical protein GNI_123570 [Gregarina niphandrodes]|uniref:Uncharacterized protein n=1 Tax=Gregarina niphandrodes TaxID=110365 RepID=A0A023B2T9_GRENI|nr:hypothetical protein GNI_123570 [Gregarina niphandrodes]EZG51730.1 hypothetical protein GNI_123570 [Gregarina niphandrodes]|eukprot:XP_011131922.1 hypothetical protein GNI_123570 [Gregarina niphandrodes]
MRELLTHLCHEYRNKCLAPLIPALHRDQGPAGECIGTRRAESAGAESAEVEPGETTDQTADQTADGNGNGEPPSRRRDEVPGAGEPSRGTVDGVEVLRIVSQWQCIYSKLVPIECLAPDTGTADPGSSPGTDMGTRKRRQPEGSAVDIKEAVDESVCQLLAALRSTAHLRVSWFETRHVLSLALILRLSERFMEHLRCAYVLLEGCTTTPHPVWTTPVSAVKRQACETDGRNRTTDWRDRTAEPKSKLDESKPDGATAGGRGSLPSGSDQGSEVESEPRSEPGFEPGSERWQNYADIAVVDKSVEEPEGGQHPQPTAQPRPAVPRLPVPGALAFRRLSGTGARPEAEVEVFESDVLGFFLQRRLLVTALRQRSYPPFTIVRVCELLSTHDRSWSNNFWKWCLALRKNIADAASSYGQTDHDVELLSAETKRHITHAYLIDTPPLMKRYFAI